MALSGSSRVLLNMVHPLVKLKMEIARKIAFNNLVVVLERADVHFDFFRVKFVITHRRQHQSGIICNKYVLPNW